MLLAAYRRASYLAPPTLRLLLARRCARGKEDAARLGERMGRAGRPRPDGRLVSIHGASVGEAQSALPLIAQVLARLPAAHVLLTTGTVTSARLMAERLPPRAFHQFVPLDAAPWVARFLDHWRPDLALWLESELWPNLASAAASRGVPMALVNARMSARSFATWSRWPGFARDVLGSFRLVLAQTPDSARRFASLGAKRVEEAGNLKFAAAPLPADAGALAALRAAIGPRPFWLAASIHPGEEAAIAEAHRRLRAQRPDVLTVVVPRHPDKGAGFAAAFAVAGTVARRSLGEAPGTADFYLADTLGELGLFYRLAPLAFVGKSLGAAGGQNPIEAAQLGCALIFGPNMQNFAEVARSLEAAGAAVTVADAAGLAAAIFALLDSPERLAARRAKAREAAQAEAGAMARIMAALDPLLAPLSEKSETHAPA